MIYFILALLFSASIMVIFRYFDKYKVDTFMAISFSYVISAVLALSISYDGAKIQSLITTHSSLVIILGIAFFFGFLIMSISIKKAGISISSVASNISVLIPVLIAYMIYNESIDNIQLVGIVLAVPAIYLFFKPEKSKKLELKFILFPLILFAITGFNNSLMRHAEHLGVNNFPMLFVGLIFSIALIVSIIFLIIKGEIKKFSLKNIGFGFILGIANIASTYFFIECLIEFPSSLFFPIYNLSLIGLAAFMGIVFFKEKFSKVNILGLILAAGAIVLMNI